MEIHNDKKIKKIFNESLKNSNIIKREANIVLMDYKKKECEIKAIYNPHNKKDSQFHLKDLLKDKSCCKQQLTNKNHFIKLSKNDSNQMPTNKKKVIHNEEIEDSDYPFFKEPKKRVILLTGKSIKVKQNNSAKIVNLNMQMENDKKDFEIVSDFQMNNQLNEIKSYLSFNGKVDNKFLNSYNRKVSTKTIKRDTSATQHKRSLSKIKGLALIKNEELKTKMNLNFDL